MSWFAVADLLRETQCHERKRTGTCSHTIKKGKRKGENPCDVTQRLIDACTCFDLEIHTDVEPKEVIERLMKRRCKNPSCHHRACSQIDDIRRWCESKRIAV